MAFRSVIHPRRRNAITSMVGLKNCYIRKNLTENGERQKQSWERRRRRRRISHPTTAEEICTRPSFHCVWTSSYFSAVQTVYRCSSSNSNTILSLFGRLPISLLYRPYINVVVVIVIPSFHCLDVFLFLCCTDRISM